MCVGESYAATSSSADLDPVPAEARRAISPTPALHIPSGEHAPTCLHTDTAACTQPTANPPAAISPAVCACIRLDPPDGSLGEVWAAGGVAVPAVAAKQSVAFVGSLATAFPPPVPHKVLGFDDSETFKPLPHRANMCIAVSGLLMGWVLVGGGLWGLYTRVQLRLHHP